MHKITFTSKFFPRLFSWGLALSDPLNMVVLRDRQHGAAAFTRDDRYELGHTARDEQSLAAILFPDTKNNSCFPRLMK